MAFPLMPAESFHQQYGLVFIASMQTPNTDREKGHTHSLSLPGAAYYHQLLY